MYHDKMYKRARLLPLIYWEVLILSQIIIDASLV